jgi:Phage terminase, small subunit
MKPADIKGEASEHWDYLADLLEAEGRLTLSDGPLLMATAFAYAIGMRLTRALMDPETPLWVVYSRPEPDGNERQEVEKHPIFGEERAQWERYRKCCNDLCLSPGTRSRAKGASPGTPKSKVAQFRAAKTTA